MKGYMISILLENGSWGYLCPRGDGASYVIKATQLGAAMWNSFEEALVMKEAMFPNTTQTVRIKSFEKPANIAKVTNAELRSLETKLNG